MSEQHLREYDIITQGQRNERYVDGQHWRSSVHLVPFFGNLGISEITAGKIQEYRIHRHQEAITKRGKPPGHSTMHREIVTLHQTLKTALRHGWLDRLPDFSERTGRPPKSPTGRGSHQRNTKSSTKRHESARMSRRRRDSTGKRNSFTTMCSSQLIPDCGPTRPGAFRDVTIVDDEDLGKPILEIEVRGKRGVGYCKSMPGAVRPFERLRSRLRPARIYGVNTPTKTSVTSAVLSEQWHMPEPTDLIFPKRQRQLFKTILDEQNLRFDREGRPRTAYSLRHTYICMRLIEGADIYQIAKNCRTSVQMIEKY